MTVVALAQVSGPAGGAEADREKGLAAAAQAFEQGADLVVLPELLVPGYGWDQDRLEAGAEPLDGPTVAPGRDLAAGAAAGSRAASRSATGRGCSTPAVLVGPRASPSTTASSTSSPGEKGVFAPGDLGLPVADTPLGRIGHLHLLRPALRRDVAGAVAGRGRARLRADRLGRRASTPCVGTPRASARRPATRSCRRTSIASSSPAPRRPGEWGEYSSSSAPRCSPILVVAGGRPLPGASDDLALADIDLASDGGASDRGGGIRPRDDRRDDVYSLMLDGRAL